MYEARWIRSPELVRRDPLNAPTVRSVHHTAVGCGCVSRRIYRQAPQRSGYRPSNEFPGSSTRPCGASGPPRCCQNPRSTKRLQAPTVLSVASAVAAELAGLSSLPRRSLRVAIEARRQHVGAGSSNCLTNFLGAKVGRLSSIQVSCGVESRVSPAGETCGDLPVFAMAVHLQGGVRLIQGRLARQTWAARCLSHAHTCPTSEITLVLPMFAVTATTPARPANSIVTTSIRRLQPPPKATMAH